MRHLFGLSVQALRAPPGSGNSPEDRLPVFRPSSQYRWVACRPVSGSIRGLRGPLRAHPAVRPATGRESRSGGELELRLRRGPRGRPCRQPYPRRGPRVDLSGLQSLFSPTNFTDFQMPPYHARSRTRTARVFFSPMRTASPRAISKRLSHPQSLRSCSPISTPLR